MFRVFFWNFDNGFKFRDMKKFDSRAAAEKFANSLEKNTKREACCAIV